ncbi:MAG: hypothetical protein EAX87_04735 [Candidatus Thorarchaeota archaeon]|nr:hypothetical protein [Candidatus Thorarchaeota archaeon]
MPRVPDIHALANTLVFHAYPELINSNLQVTWGRTSSFAQIYWDETKERISIRVNNDVKAWHESGILGLISHELSHPAQSRGGTSELTTDNDSIRRGLGPYLAIERLFAGKYEDHVIRRGKDRYLGYKSIRSQMTELEVQQLDSLLSEVGIIPSREKDVRKTTHDTLIHEEPKRSTIIVEGHRFMLPSAIKEPDIKIIERNSTIYVYADEVLVGEFLSE